MSWVICPKCRFNQIPAERCRRCGEALAAPMPPVEEMQAMSEPLKKGTSRSALRLAAVAVAALLAILLWLVLAGRHSTSPPPAPSPVPSAAVLDLSGRWHAQISKVIGVSPPRPVLKEVSIESDREGGIQSARVVFTDPGRGGVGAGYRIVTDGPRRLAEAVSRLTADPKGAALSMEFLVLPAWVPERPRLWRALEGAGPGTEPVRYALVESLETDYLVQGGINETGFLSYAFFSPPYAPERGRDVLSRVIHPEPGASLRGFRNLIWDLSGAADFLTLQLPATISGPEGGAPDRIVLAR